MALLIHEFEYDEDIYYKLQYLRERIEKEGIARQHGDTLEKRGISVDDFLNPSNPKHLKKIQYYSRINASNRKKFLEFERKYAQTTRFSETTSARPGKEWDTLLSNWIRENRSSGSFVNNLTTRLSKLVFSPPEFPPEKIAALELAARDLIFFVERQHILHFLDSKFPLFGFMRDVPTDEKKHPKLFLWQGEADAIAYSRELGKLVIVDFKVVDNLLDYWEKKNDLCGKHLHQCLVYAKLLQLHLCLSYLPPSLIVVIDKFTGMDGYFPLFEDYPKECYEKLDEYEWFTEQPPLKRPLRIVNTDKLLNENCKGCEGLFHPDERLQDIFARNATVKDLLAALGYDSLEVFQQKQQ